MQPGLRELLEPQNTVRARRWLGHGGNFVLEQVPGVGQQRIPGIVAWLNVQFTSNNHLVQAESLASFGFADMVKVFYPSQLENDEHEAF